MHSLALKTLVQADPNSVTMGSAIYTRESFRIYPAVGACYSPLQVRLTTRIGTARVLCINPARCLLASLTSLGPDL